MLKGSMPALVTPFKNGELDLNTLKAWWIGTLNRGATVWFLLVQLVKVQH